MRVLLWPSTKACRSWSPHLSALSSYCFSSSLALSGFILSPSWRHIPLQLHTTVCCVLSPGHDPLWAQTHKSSLKHHLAIDSSFSHPVPPPQPSHSISSSLSHLHKQRMPVTIVYPSYYSASPRRGILFSSLATNTPQTFKNGVRHTVGTCLILVKWENGNNATWNLCWPCQS